MHLFVSTEVSQERWPVHPMATVTKAGVTTVMLLYFAMGWIAGTALMDSVIHFLFYRSHSL